ncbi:transglutaminase-like domain-containing protein [Candidatus Omnitrophota bacterium]
MKRTDAIVIVGRRVFVVIIILIVLLISKRITADYQLKERDLEFDYNVLIENIPAGSSILKVWIPIIQDTGHQIVKDFHVEPNKSASVSFDKKFGNKILNYSVEALQDSHLMINVHYIVKRFEFINKNWETADRKYADKNNLDDVLDHYLQPSRYVTLSSNIRSLAAEITKGKRTVVEKAQAIYTYVFQTVAYDKIVPGWGSGDTERVCLLKVGNCTDFHSLFISLSRASGIPAKFVMGFPVSLGPEGEIPGYHCWAEFYDDHLGWIPVDISEAWKHKDKADYYFGAIDENRIELSVGRDIILEPAHNGEPLNYFLYPYVEVDGKKFNEISTTFKYKNSRL